VRHWTGWIVVALAGFVAGWLVFDGCHALVTGDYVTPDEGEYAGRLGPWAKLFEAVAIDPRSKAVMVFHVLFGLAWLAAVLRYVRDARRGLRGLVVMTVASLWYLPVGTVLGVVQLGILFAFHRSREA
jgi:hypothetical protein